MVRVRVRVSVRLRVIAVLLFKKSQKAELSLGVLGVGDSITDNVILTGQGYG